MGVVYRAHHRRLNRVVALKLIREGREGSEGEVHRIELEAQVLASVTHPGIVTVYDLGMLPADGHRTEATPYFCMEFMSRGSLSDLVRARRFPTVNSLTMVRKTHRAAIVQAVTLVRELARSMHFVHGLGLVHLDLKPGNILMDGTGRWRISDFGLARRLPENGRLRGVRSGTPGYAAPEQWCGNTLTPTTDAYALGAILYWLLCGRPPFQGSREQIIMAQGKSDSPTPPGRLVAGLDPELDAICIKCLHRVPDERYATAEELANDLQRVLESRPAMAAPASRWRQLQLWRRRSPTVARLTTAVALMLVALTVGSVAAAFRFRELAESRQVALTNETAARRLAAEQRDLALGVVKSVVFDLHHELRHKAGVRGLREKLLAQAVRKLQEVARAADNSSEISHTQTWVHLDIGDIFWEAGRLQDAERQFQAALAVAEALAEEEPGCPDAGRNLAACWSKLADVSLRAGRAAEAVERYQRALGLHQSLYRQDSQDDQARRDLKVSYTKLGDVSLALGQVAAAKEAYQEARQLCERAAKSSADPALSRWDLAVAYSKVGEALLDEDPKKALEEFKKDLSLLEALAKSAAGVASTRNDLLITPAIVKRSILVAHSQIGEAALRLGNYAAARDSFGKALGAAKEQVRDDPTDAGALRDLSTSHEKVGDVLLELGEPEGAKAEYEESLQVAEKLVKIDPTHAEAGHGLATSCMKVGEARLALGAKGVARAEEVLGRALKALQASQSGGHDPRNLHLQAVAFRQLGEANRLQGKDGEARRVLLRSKDIREQLAWANAASTKLQVDLATVYGALGELEEDCGRRAEARRWDQKALEVLATLQKSGNASDQPRLRELVGAVKERVRRTSAD
jgi:tetratricopeptide (TPR) repeat protein